LYSEFAVEGVREVEMSQVVFSRDGHRVYRLLGDYRRSSDPEGVSVQGLRQPDSHGLELVVPAAGPVHFGDRPGEPVFYTKNGFAR